MAHLPEVVAMSQMHFQLFVIRRDARSARAEQQLRRACETRYGNVRIEVVDLTERPDLAEEHDIVATPMVLRLHPPPTLRLVGDLSDPHALSAALELDPPSSSPQGDIS